MVHSVEKHKNSNILLGPKKKSNIQILKHESPMEFLFLVPGMATGT